MPRRSLVRYYLKLTGNEALELLNEATQWDDLRSPGSSAGGGSTNPTFTTFITGATAVGVYAWRFNAAPAGTDDEDLMFDCQYPHGIKTGTVAAPSIVYPHLHWSPNDANAGNVGWGLEYTEADIGAVFPATQIMRTPFAAGGAQYLHQLNGWAGLSSTTRQFSTMIKVRVVRTDVGGIDTYASTCFLHEFDIHYEIDTIGSRGPVSK